MERPANAAEQGNREISAGKISDIINKINTAFHIEWKKSKLEKVQNFLSRTWAGLPLPVLSICGRGTQEIRFSKYLGYFLDGSKAHGLGYRYLNELLNFVTGEKIETFECKVESEKFIGKIKQDDKLTNCICDNVITCENHIIVIEQKIKSGESDNPNNGEKQLVRYDKAILENPEFSGKKIIRIYLSPTGKYGAGLVVWNSLSHDDLVEIGLKVLHKGGISEAARENLKRLLIDFLLGPFNKDEELISTLMDLAKKCVFNPTFEDQLQFERLIQDNQLLVNVLMEG